MAIRGVVTRGYGNGTFNGTIPLAVLRGYIAAAASAPTFTGTIPDQTIPLGYLDVATGLSSYFAEVTSYTIDPAVATGWTFNTSDATLTVNPNTVGTFGNYIVTGTGPGGSVDSNGFSVTITGTPSVRTFKPERENRTISVKRENRNFET